MPFMQVQDAAELIRLEYAEMPGLQLTFWQAQRLWNLADELCDRALNTLISQGFLMRTHDGRYTRRNAERPIDGPIVTPMRAMGSKSVKTSCHGSEWTLSVAPEMGVRA